MFEMTPPKKRDQPSRTFKQNLPNIYFLVKQTFPILNLLYANRVSEPYLTETKVAEHNST